MIICNRLGIKTGMALVTSLSLVFFFGQFFKFQAMNYYGCVLNVTRNAHGNRTKSPLNITVIHPRGKLCTEPFPLLPSNMTLIPLVDVPIPKRGVFLSCVDSDERHSNSSDSFMLECFFRTDFLRQGMSKVFLNDNFHVASRVYDNVLPGEDGRVFRWNEKVHVTDNYMGRMKIMEINDQGEFQSWPLPVNMMGNKSKNIIPVPTETHLLLVDFEAETIYSCIRSSHNQSFALDCTQNSPENIQWTYLGNAGGRRPTNMAYRGGTAGHKVSNNTFIGFGHLSLNYTHHDMFSWRLLMSTNKNWSMTMEYVNHYGGNEFHHEIKDPTSMVCVDNAWHVITAESDLAWYHHNQLLVQRVYRVVQEDINSPLAARSISHFNPTR